MRIELCEKHLGTPIAVTLHAEDSDAARSAISAAFCEAARIEKLYSRFLADNALAKLNAQVGQWTRVDDELWGLLQLGNELHAKTFGAFDLSVKSILEGWGYDAAYSLEEGAPGTNGSILLREGEVLLQAPIELGGLGKGYAIDRMFDILKTYEHCCINAGGDLRLQGHDGEKAWRVVFEHPLDIQKGIGFVEPQNLALACSSPSRRTWRNRHHLVDPRTKMPAQNMLAVYTQAPTALLADAYSTALFVLGYEEARGLLPELPVKALLVSPRGEIYRSPGFQGELFTAKS